MAVPDSQPRLELTLIEVRKIRYIYVVQAEREHRGDEQFCVKSEQFRYKPRANTARGSSGTGQLTYLPNTKEWKGQLWSIYNDEMLSGFRVKPKVDLVQCRIVRESAAHIYHIPYCAMC